MFYFPGRMPLIRAVENAIQASMLGKGEGRHAQRLAQRAQENVELAERQRLIQEARNGLAEYRGGRGHGAGLKDW